MPATTATITNISRQLVTVILDHAAFRNKESGFQRGIATFANYTEDGTRQVESVRRAYPPSLTLQPGESVSDLHPAVTKCSQVPALIAGRIVKVQFNEEKPQT